jgi:glycine amidinotransferase
MPGSLVNEWDPLEEVIVGSLEGAVMPPSHITVTRTIPPLAAQLYRLFGGHRHPRIMVDAACRELEGFVKLLQAEGITVKRPDAMDFTVRTRTPLWSSKGYCVACPRDGFLIVGDEIIETSHGMEVAILRAACLPETVQGLFRSRSPLDRDAAA